MLNFTHVFVGIGKAGGSVVDGIESDVVKVRINPGYYILRTGTYSEKIASFFSRLPENSLVWIVFEDKPVNVEIVKLISENLPEGTMGLAYVFTPSRELFEESKPSWAKNFETVFYDSLWEFLKRDVPLLEAYEEASVVISRALTLLHKSLEGQMVINVDYADFFSTVRGGNVGILRLLGRVDFDWHWGVWDRGIVITIVDEGVALRDAHAVLQRFHDLLKEKDIIWGLISRKTAGTGIETLTLLVREWGE
ncbi:hypothetical protein [Thermococcus zilligii]|uniref:hypothetical protein n=1 Tax=Thermococcus zilligii TaxID=54076 RepID=UPI00029ACDED|nr:hypothetical protein [Thermococcus zilligii]